MPSRWGCHDFPFKIVADHPGLVRADAEHVHRMIVGSLLGLAEASGAARCPSERDMFG
jgi:hypothetical protein